jgi:hypothetical protein
MLLAGGPDGDFNVLAQSRETFHRAPINDSKRQKQSVLLLERVAAASYARRRV